MTSMYGNSRSVIARINAIQHRASQKGVVLAMPCTFWEKAPIIQHIELDNAMYTIDHWGDES